MHWKMSCYTHCGKQLPVENFTNINANKISTFIIKSENVPTNFSLINKAY